MGESHVKNLKLLFYVLYITVPFHGMNSVWNHTISTAVDVYWWLSALTEYLYCPACWIILPHPWGKLIKSQLLGKHHFKVFCENCVLLIWRWICSQKIKDSESKLTLAPLGGGPKGPPCGFSQIAPEVLGISLWNLPYLSGQQFHTLCQKIRTQVIIGQPWVTSEWRHVSPILINKMGLRESPPLVQF